MSILSDFLEMCTLIMKVIGKGLSLHQENWQMFFPSLLLEKQYLDPAFC